MSDPTGHQPSDDRQSPDSVDAAVQQIWARTRDTVLARVDVLDEAVTALVEQRLDEDTRAGAEQAAHKLAGSAGTFGMPEGSRLARRLEQRFATSPDPDDAWSAAEEVVALRQALESPPQPSASSEVSEHPTVLLLTADEALTERLRRAGADANLDVRAAGGHDPARELVEDEPPAAVVVDAALGEGVDDAVALLDALAPAEDVPTLMLADADSQADRVAAVRAGVDTFLPRQLDAGEVAQTIEERLRSPELGRILACDDDVAVLEAIKAILAGPRVAVDTVADPRQLWEAITNSGPDLVLLDRAMPHVDGLELCRMLRSDPASVALPVMFLTAYTDRASIREAFEAGADDVVGKPLVDAELRVRVENRLDRTRLLRRFADTDPLTGLDNRRASLTALQRQLALADRHGQPLTLAVVDVDDFDELERTHGHAATDAILCELARRLQAQFRTSDVTARWGGDEFVVGMYGMSNHDAVRRLTKVLDEFTAVEFESDGGPFTATFTAGLAEHSGDGDDVDSLYRIADDALRGAKRTGGRQVRGTDRRGDDLPRNDVVVVEDDPAVSELLVHALGTRGYEVVVLEDGEEAHGRLAAETADLFPRVILLDVELPALNGLDLLRQLGRHGVLERTRVVMLTGRAGEEEVIEALRLGASDHVAKPFSIPELLERVRGAVAV